MFIWVLISFAVVWTRGFQVSCCSYWNQWTRNWNKVNDCDLIKNQSNYLSNKKINVSLGIDLLTYTVVFLNTSFFPERYSGIPGRQILVFEFSNILILIFFVFHHNINLRLRKYKNWAGMKNVKPNFSL